MPNLGLHIGFALDCEQRLGHPLLREHRGSYLLGCTTPDIRLFLGWSRESTHFFNLSTDPRGAGIRQLLESNPHLKETERLSRETIAFLLGYISHLHTDETWIVQVWRRYFGKGAVLADDPLVAVLDRAFQFELDRRERQRIVGLEGAVGTIKRAYEGVEIGFINQDLLRQWQEEVIGRLGRDLPWERFRGYVRRVHRVASEEELDLIVAKVPEMLEKVSEYLNDAEITAFREQAIGDFLATAQAYLKAGEIP